MHADECIEGRVDANLACVMWTAHILEQAAARQTPVCVVCCTCAGHCYARALLRCVDDAGRSAAKIRNVSCCSMLNMTYAQNDTHSIVVGARTFSTSVRWLCSTGDTPTTRGCVDQTATRTHDQRRRHGNIKCQSAHVVRPVHGATWRIHTDTGRLV
jgi:hypothetical protein